MIISAIAFAWSLASAQAQNGVFPTIFPAPTGRNGLEDYVLARDLMDQGYWSAYANWTPPEGRAAALLQKQEVERYMGPTLKDPKQIAIEQRLSGLTMLQVREEEMSAFSRSLQLILSGNSKPCEVATVMNGVRVPTATIFPGLGTLERDVAYVEASRSRTDQMIVELESVLTIADHGCRTTYIGSSLATLAQMKVCAMFAENLDRLSLQDANAMEELVNRFLERTPVFVDAYGAAFRQEQESVAESIRQLKRFSYDPPKNSGATKDKQGEAGMSVISTMSQSEVDQMIQRVQGSIGATGRAFLSRFNGPEQNWLASDATDDGDIPDPAIRTADDLETIFTAHWSLPEVTRPRRLADALRARAMMRLLRLHARVIAFKWENERLPKSLAELNLPVGYDFDPLSNKPFVYQVADNDYKLYSLGNKWTGKIELGAVASGSQRAPEVDP